MAAEVAVDLMVADGFSGTGSRRSGIIPPHARDATRRTRGLEGAAVDCDVLADPSFEPGVDRRVIEVKVAGAAALIIAKSHKIGERSRTDDGRRLVAKDAGDVFRLMYESDLRDVARRSRHLLADTRSAASTREGFAYLEELFGAGRRGVRMAVDALGTEVDPAEISALMPAYVAALLRATAEE